MPVEPDPQPAGGGGVVAATVLHPVPHRQAVGRQRRGDGSNEPGPQGGLGAVEVPHLRQRLADRPIVPPIDSACPAGRIIVLNGASSSGKTTLARALQPLLPTPFLHVSSDLLVDMLPARRDPSGPFAWWTDMRPTFFAGFHRCIPALASAGNDLILDHIIEFPTWRTELSTLLQPFDVYLVGVHCPVDEIDRRERLRGDRRPGEGRTHVAVDLIHTFGPYDLDIDTTSADPATLAQSILTAWQTRSPTSRLHDI